MAGKRSSRDAPSGHLQVRGDPRHRVWYALWRDADGRHKKRLGPAHVKDPGRRTPRGAVVRRAADGPKPDPSYLSPADARDEVSKLLAAAREPTDPRYKRDEDLTFGWPARRGSTTCSREGAAAVNDRRLPQRHPLLPVGRVSPPQPSRTIASSSTTAPYLRHPRRPGIPTHGHHGHDGPRRGLDDDDLCRHVPQHDAAKRLTALLARDSSSAGISAPAA
jgi:hypothetical protein